MALHYPNSTRGEIPIWRFCEGTLPKEEKRLSFPMGLRSMAKHKKKEHDFAVTAFRVVQKTTGQVEAEPEQIESEIKPELVEGKNPHAVALGRLGGLKGGKARANKLTPEQRKEIAQKAALARWGK